MPIQYTNRRSQTYYLHQGTTKTGKPKYYFSMKSVGNLVDKIPDGFEIYENPNAQVFLRKIQPKIITDSEIALVKQLMKQYSKLQYYQIDVKKNTIIVFEADQNVEALSEILKFSPITKDVGAENLLAQIITYSPVLHFVLIDDKKRMFIVERYCYLGSIDDWIKIGKPDKLLNQIKKYIKHLGQDLYYDLY